MSAIAGYWNLNAAPACEDTISRMIGPLKRRGPDGVNLSVSGPLALAHVCLATTPQARTEILPLSHPETGCVILADARLDYRDELEAKLDLDCAGRMVRDGELILQSYLRWGTSCLNHLEGDFAFVLFDPREKRLFAARDPVGMRRLAYYHKRGAIFAFATDPLALSVHPDIAGTINPERIGDFLEGQEVIDLKSTFFKDVYRLKPAHFLIVDKDGLKTSRYWRADPPQPLNLPTDDAYAEVLCDALVKAVETRLRGNDPIGSMLSGGMDSSSVCAIASRILARANRPELVTVSAMTQKPDCVESETIRIAQSLEGIAPRSVFLEDPDAYRDQLAAQLEMLDNPFDAGMTALRAVYADAQGAGIKVLFDGACGDTTLGPQDVPLWHIRHGRLLAAWREIRGERWVYRMQEPSFTEMRRKVLTAVLPDTINQKRFQKARNQWVDASARTSLLDPEFARSIDMPRRRQAHMRRLNEHLRSPLGDRAARMLHASVTEARERYDRTAGAFGIEPRDPFADTRLIKVMMQFPIEQFRHNGWHKIALRRAMKGWLPDEIRWRRGKEHLGHRFTERFQFDGAEERAELLGHLAPYIQAAELSSAKERLKTGAGVESDAKLYHLALWLQRVSREDRAPQSNAKPYRKDQ